MNVSRPHAFVGAAARKGRIIGTLAALLSGLSAFSLAEMVTSLAHKQSSGLLYALGAWASKYLATHLLTATVLQVGNEERNRARTGFFSLLSGGRRSRGYVGDLVQQADRLGLIPLVQASYANLRLAPVSLVVLFLAGGWMSTAVAVALITISIPLYIKAGRDSELLAERYEADRTELERRELQLLESGQELRGLGASEFAAEEISALSAREHRSALRAVRAALQSSLITEFLSGVGIGLVAMISGFALLGSRTTLLRALIAVLFTNELFTAVRRFGSEFHQSEEAEAALRIFSTLSTHAKPQVRFPEANNLVVTPGRKPVHFALAPGARILLSGPSGSGKTSLLEALLGFREPLSGEVSIGDVPIAYITPHEYLFAGTLRENLDPSTLRSDSELTDALGVIGLTDPRFSVLSAVIGPNGEGLSSGEQVRFLLARGIAAHAQLFVIDDVAGLLDLKTRKLVCAFFLSQPHLSVIEAAIDRPLIAPTSRIELSA